MPQESELLARPGQPLRDHLLGVARRAGGFAAIFGCGDWGRAAGVLHDIGKASQKFQHYIRNVDADQAKRRNGGDHSTAGAREAAAAWRGVGKLLAYAIAGHHGALPDGLSNAESSLAHRLDPARRHIEDCAAWRDCLGPDAAPAAPDFAHHPFALRPPKNLGARAAFFVRMLFSCLVDADRLDAEAAGDAKDKARAERRAEYPGIAELRARLDAFLADKTTRADHTPVNRIRGQVLEACRAAAELAPGLFSLTVPTGGGKTLSSLAFALSHAERHNLARVVYVIPYTSIIEQNARVFREALGDPDGDFVVEHHSNLVPPEGDDDDRPHPATENWDAPVIVTTAVQFFESLFSAHAGRCRKLHNLAKSVVILDEAQMLPAPYLYPCVEALRELTASYGASVVLCTATQPALNAPKTPEADGLPDGLVGVREIMPDPVALHEKLKRVHVRHLGRLSDVELADRLAAERQALCIAPTRRMARKIYDALRAAAGAGAEGEVFHLSALMCPEHRTAVLKRIKQTLSDKRPCRVVSTTLVEAGVDVDFPVVYRAEAGIDSIAQAAGRCNREGKLPEPGRVYVFTPEDGLPPGVFRDAAQAGQKVAKRHAADLLHPDAVRDYFLELYWGKGMDALDDKKILKSSDACVATCDFPFREIEEAFRFIGEPTQGLIVPRDDPKALELVRALDALESGDRAGGLLRRLQPHTVSLHLGEIRRLETAGAIRRTGPGDQFFVLANSDLYDSTYGLDLFRDDPGVYDPNKLTR